MKRIELRDIVQYPLGTKVQIKGWGVFYFIKLTEYDLELFDGIGKVYLTSFMEENEIEEEDIEISILSKPTINIIEDILVCNLAYSLEEPFSSFNEIELHCKKLQLFRKAVKYDC